MSRGAESPSAQKAHPPGAPGERRSPLAELTKARLREFSRQRGLVFWVFGFPLLMAIGLGLAFRERPVERPRVAVVASGESPLLRALLESPNLAAERVSTAEAAGGLARSRFALSVDLAGAQPVFRYDPQAGGAPLARALAEAALQKAAGRADPLTLREELSTQVGTRYIDFLIPGLLALNVMGSSLWSIGYNLVVQRKRKLLKRYAVTPMQRSHFLLSYFLARAVFLVFEMGILVSFGVIAFGTVVQGNPLALAALAFVGALAFAGLGLWVGARGESTEVTQGWLNLVQMPMWLLSGVYFSNDGFPAWLRPLIDALPLTLLADGMRSVYNEGAGFREVATAWIGLSLWGGLGFFVAGRRFRWM